MRRILFSWNGLDIYSYPAMLYVGLLVGIFAGGGVAKHLGLNPDRFATALLILLVPALVGSRLFFVLMHWDAFRSDLGRIWRRGDGGMAMYGGLILAVPLSVAVLGALHLPFGPFWDAATFSILIGMAFTRVGCLLNGCCSGRPTERWFGLDLPDHRGRWRRRIPTQLLEMAWAAALLIGGAATLANGPFAGSIFCMAVVGYAVGRTLFETLREDYTGGRQSVVIRSTSILLTLAALGGAILAWPR